MFVLFLSLVLSAEQDITICYHSCPNTIKGTSVIVFRADDISRVIKYSLSNEKNNLYFYNTTQFTFSLDASVFQGYTVEFFKLVDSNNLSLEIDCTATSEMTGTLIFKNIDVNLFCSLKTQPVKIGNLVLQNSRINLFSTEPKLAITTLIADNSVQIFQSVNVLGDSASLSPGIDLDIGSDFSLSAQATDNGAILTYNQKSTTFSYEENIPTKRFDINNAKKCEFEYQCSEISKFIQFSVSKINNLYFLNQWPNSAVIDVKNSEPIIICANSTVLPVSIKSSTKTNAILTQPETKITGDVYSPIVLSYSGQKSQTRKTVTFLSSFNGSSLDLGSSFCDVTLANLATDISGTGSFPFIFRVGEGGASTVTVLSTSPSASTTQKNSITIYPDFSSPISDNMLKNLLTNEWNLLTLTDVTFSNNQISVSMQREPFIHGFVQGDSCLSCRVEVNRIVLSATSPSLLPITLCYDGNNGKCNSEEAMKIDSVDSISSYFNDGVKRAQLLIKVDRIETVDLRSIKQGISDVRITLIGFDNAIVNTIQTDSNSQISCLELQNLQLGTNIFTVKEIAFSGCKMYQSSKLTFIDCESIICDDDFIKNIGQKISSSGHKIKKVSLNTERYNSITIGDTKFIFYDYSFNPSELPLNAFDFIDIGYDVGKSNGNLNLTMETNNPLSFNVTFTNRLSTALSNVPQLILFSWSQTKDADFKTYFNHNRIDAKVILTSRYTPKQLIPIGTGILSYETQYLYSTSICSTQESDKQLCPQGSIFASFDQLNSKIHEVNDENIKIYIKSSNDVCPSVDLSNVNEKLTLFTGLTSESAIEISSSQQLNAELTATTFRNIKIKKASSQTSNIVFGELKLENTEVDSSFKEIDVEISDFYCQFINLHSFKSISISKNMVVNGSISNEQSTVEFQSKEQTSHLSASISSSASLTVGNKYIKIGETKFLFNSASNDHDAILDFESNKNNIGINKDNEASESNIPKIAIRKSSGCSFTFSNNWNLDSSKKSIFMFSNLDNTKIYLSGENTPASFTGIGELSLISKSEQVGISGSIEFQESSTNSIKLLSDIKDKSTIHVSQYVKIKNNVDIKFDQPNIVFDVLEVISENEKSIIQPELFTSLEGDSLLSIKNEMKGVSISPDYRIQIPIASGASEAKLTEYYRYNHLLIKVHPNNAKDASPKSITFIGNKPTNQGITKNNINISIDSATGEISLKLKNNPAYILATICYEYEDNSCDVKLSEDNIDNFADLIPSQANKIDIIFGKQNTKPLNLNIGKIKNSIVSIHQVNDKQLSIQMELGSHIISILSLNQIFAKVTDKSTFKISTVELKNGARIDEIEGIETINMELKTDWKDHPLEPTTKNIILNISGPSLLFTNEGFIVDSDTKISSSSYPKLTFQLEGSSPATLDASDDLVDFNNLTIYSSTNHFVLGPSWASKSLNTRINIVFDNPKDIFVSTSSYPFVQFPQLMEAETIQINPNVLPYNVPSDITFDNIKSVLDFSHVRESTDKARVTFKSLTMRGSSSLSAKGVQASVLLSDNDRKHPLVISNVNIEKNSTVTLSDVSVVDTLKISGNSTLKGSFEVAKSIVAEWKVKEIPKIIFEDDPNEVPQSIEFKFAEESISGKEEQYNKFLYHKSFNLIEMKSDSKCKDSISAFKFVSQKVPAFGSKSVLDASCNDGSLVLYGARRIDEDGNENKSKKNIKKIMLIVLIVVDVILFVAIICILVIFCLNKRTNPNEISSSQLISTSSLV